MSLRHFAKVGKKGNYLVVSKQHIFLAVGEKLVANELHGILEALIFRTVPGNVSHWLRTTTPKMPCTLYLPWSSDTREKEDIEKIETFYNLKWRDFEHFAW